MNAQIINKQELDTFFHKHMANTLIAIKGSPQPWMTYEDGDPILHPINLAWKCVETGEIVPIHYEKT